jgi:hypothetical protein
MDIDNYINNSRDKRNKLLKVAEAFLSQTISKNNPPCLSDRNSPDLYSGPTPLKLKQFEEEVGSTLKRIFSPGHRDFQDQRKILKALSIDDTIKKTYSRNSPTVKKKQLVILPKKNQNATLRIPEILINKKKNFLSPDLTTDATNSSVRSEYNKSTLKPKKFLKEDLFLPVLSTSGTHEYRSKIYKYK